MYKVRIAGMNELSALKDRWSELVLSMRLPSVFCTWEWMNTWWKHFGQSYHALVLLVYNQNELVGILPLASKIMFIEDSVFPTRTIVLWSSKDLYPDHLDIIAAPEHALASMKAAMSFLFDEYRQWDVICFSYVDDDSSIFQEIKQNWITQKPVFQKKSVAPYIDIENDFDTDFDCYLKFLGGNARSALKRKRKKVFESSGVEYSSSSMFGDKNPMEDIFSLHKLRAEKKGIQSTFVGDKLLDFHTEVSRSFEKNDWLRLRFLLKSDTKPIAALYCYGIQGRWNYYQSGLDPEWEQMGAGSVLLYQSIEEAFKTGMKEFDFLRGDEEYKKRWANKEREQYDIVLYKSNLISALSRFLFSARSFVKGMVKKID